MGAKSFKLNDPMISFYINKMVGIDQGDQHHTVGAGFANVSHLKKMVLESIFGHC